MVATVLSLAVGNDFPRHLINPRQSQPYSYADSPLTSFKNRDAEFESGPQAGAPLMNQQLSKNKYLLNYLSNGFTGLYFEDPNTIDQSISQCFSELDGQAEGFTLIAIGRDILQSPVETVSLTDGDKLMACFGARRGTFYLVRPDRHICARWRNIQTNEVIAAYRQALGDRPQ